MGRVYLVLDSVATVEITVRLDFIELRLDGRCVAVIDRDQLRAWLQQSAPWRYPVDDVTWTRLETGQLLLGVSRAGVWALDHQVTEALLATL